MLLDLKEECEKYGEVREVVVPRPADPKMSEQLMGTGNFGKVCGMVSLLMVVCLCWVLCCVNLTPQLNALL